ncbi:hypothetical protein FPQ18DRAFT_35232 [Pyronema domesticum]|uniref:Uncharacterized protein n=1 Tax=Pyronema omphalodes (strain CBS 100304) TaxID=1076935 RepID=U4KY92_PYROM|nr:hypothetical protein FPQ18DRAFT_35232 [Pyronema domesticum]CCX07177.1 Similar to hypothetical protein [Tuber melanosporum Mel28]; acc. no. XP_002835390 [Pyronema omphalodes CBS 100304]
MDRPRHSKLHRCGQLIWNLCIVFVVYGIIFEVIVVSRTGSFNPFSKPVASSNAPTIPEGSLSGGVNYRLRPTTLVKNINDAYAGPRRHVDTLANYGKLLEACRGSATGLEKMRFVYDCLEYLSKKEDDYLFLPSDSPASKSDPSYPAVDTAAPASQTNIGQCPGPVQLFHTYWTGPSTWRVELFIKAYLYTQNLPCSRLWIWLDSDTNPTAVADMMQDKGFARFLPLVERGDITLKAWNFPTRIPLPKGTVASDPLYSQILANRALKSAGSTEEKKIEDLGDGVIIHPDGSEWIEFSERQMTFLPVAVSDAVRFIVLHLNGGVYLDMDIMLLRDMRPLLLTPDHNFAERWAVHSHPGDFNTAVLSLNANSSLSSYLVRGGVRMGLNFHPMIVGRMAWKDGRVEELAMFETGLFDPIWGEFNWGREGRCTVPCFKDYGQAFLGTREAVREEWQSFDGPQLEEEEAKAGVTELKKRDAAPASAAEKIVKGEDGSYGGREYRLEEDKYPPTNRTLENFFRGAWSYHIHNQWAKHPQPNSWFSVAQNAHDGFLSGERTNLYGEKWGGPEIMSYDRWREFD